jgi:hypothetical protein
LALTLQKQAILFQPTHYRLVEASQKLISKIISKVFPKKLTNEAPTETDITGSISTSFIEI